LGGGGGRPPGILGEFGLFRIVDASEGEKIPLAGGKLKGRPIHGCGVVPVPEPLPKYGVKPVPVDCQPPFGVNGGSPWDAEFAGPCDPFEIGLRLSPGMFEGGVNKLLMLFCVW